MARMLPRLATAGVDAWLQARIKIDPSSGCWVWQQALNRGYGETYIAGRKENAHRAVYEIFRGKVADDLTCDHLCRNTACVNPDHIEIVTHAVNIRRAVPFRPSRSLTHCARGHEFSPENTRITKDGWKRCKACKRLEGRRRLARIAARKQGSADA